MRTAGIPKVCAIVPARGGSKGLPRKNVLPLDGLPLIAHTILAARGCPHVDACVVTTEDPEIAAIGRRYGVEIIDRPDELAGDFVESGAVVRHALEHLAAAGRMPEYFVLLQPTSPLRTSAHLTACIERFFESDARSAVSVTEAAESPYKMLVEENGGLRPLFDYEAVHAPRQTLPRVYAQNGAIYLTRSAAFLASGRFLIEPVMPFVMEAEAGIDIDTGRDLAMAEAVRRTGKPFDLGALGRDPAWRREMAETHRARARQFAGARERLEACPICGGRELAPFARVFDYDYATCGACGHLFCRDPIPDEGELYAADSPQARVYLNEDLFQKRVARIARPKVEFVGGIVARRGLWVDIGCATGEVLAAAVEAGWQARGYEYDASEAAFGRAHGLEIAEQRVTADNAAEAAAGATVISLVNILEHVRDPRALLCAIAGAAGPDTFMVCEVPRHPSLSSFNSRAFPELACRHVYPPDHLHIFTERSLAEMLAAAGLEAIAVWTFGQDYQDLICCAAAAGETPGDDLYCRAAELAPRMQAVIDEAGLSDALLVVARKRSGGA